MFRSGLSDYCVRLRRDGDWYVRQWHYQGEQWNDLFCLNPKNSQVKASESLKNELNLVATLDVKKAG